MTDDDGRPSFTEVARAVTPPGTNWDDWKAAMRQAHQDGGYRPGQVAPDISQPVPRDWQAHYGQAPQADRIRGLARFAGTPSDAPADPFAEADAPSVALAEMFHGMVRSGIPVASVEAILGHMMAAHGRSETEAPGE